MCIALVETCSRGTPRPFDVQVKGGGPMEKHASLIFPLWRISTTIRATYIQPFFAGWSQKDNPILTQTDISDISYNLWLSSMNILHFSWLRPNIYIYIYIYIPTIPNPLLIYICIYIYIYPGYIPLYLHYAHYISSMVGETTITTELL